MKNCRWLLLLIACLCLLTLTACGGDDPTTVVAVTPVAPAPTLPYAIVDTNQSTCYDAAGAVASCPGAGAALSGQDAQHSGNRPSFSANGDGTVSDQVTGLIWQQSPDTDGNGVIDAADKLTYDQAVAGAAALRLGGFSDWRLPTIKELYSLIDFSGTDPSGYDGTSTAGMIPFIDTGYFAFGYGDTGAGERLIDAQFASATRYVSTTMNGNTTLFGVNFADGTVTDHATGLMWSQDDSGAGLDWAAALAWVEARNGENFLGHNDWRLPQAKELQSLVDYTRSPDTTASAAIDPLFNVTPIVNEVGQADFPCYWSSTTHANGNAIPGGNGAYLAFGRAMGYMNGVWLDVHGAGAQRSDPKVGDPAAYPAGHGPQGDAIRIYNFVRLVRDAG